ncbi:MAG: hypothetical protein PHZ00_04720 [Candidatus Peribacteraceae bacterium]|nr:hypothetical protein [Candidatus Peribacteraceae bacterium]
MHETGKTLVVPDTPFLRSDPKARKIFKELDTILGHLKRLNTSGEVPGNLPESVIEYGIKQMRERASTLIIELNRINTASQN